jgi:hypothetical protein
MLPTELTLAPTEKTTMQPLSTSGLYSLLKIGALTFAGAFLGALTLAGPLPTTLHGFAELTLPALGAAVAAEVYYLRAQIAALLAQLGQAQAPGAPAVSITAGPSVTVTPAADKRGFVAVLLLPFLALFGIVAAFVALAAGCTPAQAVQAIDLSAAACQVAENQPAGQPFVDIICALDGVGNTIAIDLGAEGDAGAAAMALATVPLDSVTVRLPSAEAPAFLAAHTKATAAAARARRVHP